MSSLGKGTSTNFDVLVITKGMTVEELIDHLNTLPRKGKLGLFEAIQGSRFATQSVDKSRMMVPVEVVAGGKMSTEET